MQTSLEKAVFFILLFAASVLFLWILLPYYGAILWAVVLALVFHPLYRRLLKTFNDRKNIAAFTTLQIASLIVIVPGILLALSLVEEARNLYQHISAKHFSMSESIESLSESLPWLRKVLDTAGISISTLDQDLATQIRQAGGLFAKNGISLSQNALIFFLELGLMLYLCFFLLRDGRMILDGIFYNMPLGKAKQEKLYEKCVAIINAAIKGNFLVALIQGGLNGIVFWMIGIPNALLWTMVMIVTCLVPVVGSAIIWAPVAIYLLIVGDIAKALILIVIGSVFVGLIDNLLRPRLVGRETKIPDYLILFTTVGGISLFGINGFIMGPLIAGLFIVLWEMLAEHFETNPEA